MPTTQPAFWSERNQLARKLLHDGDPKTAYAVVVAHGQTRAPKQRADADFLAGFIALRMLHDPATAAETFRRPGQLARGHHAGPSALLAGSH